MKRSIEFRIWDNEEGKYFEPIYEAYKGNLLDLSISINGRLLRRTLESSAEDESRFEGKYELEQFTGLTDKKGSKIFEGDIIRFKRPYRTTQTHTGSNIPNGSYTEPMEPEIKIVETEVVFDEGIFGFYSSETRFGENIMNLSWEAGVVFDEESLKDAVSYSGRDVFDWHNGEDGDLDYLLSEYNYESLEVLLKDILGVEVIGNIHDNPEFLK